MSTLIPLERIESKILLIHGQKVMLSFDLAELYEVEPRSLMQAVKRNSKRFPADFMFQLNWDEAEALRSHFVTSSSDQNRQNHSIKSQIVISSWGGVRRARPYAFTEQGVAMLSSVLRSERAVQVNIMIMRAFVKLREILVSHKDLARKLDEMEKKYDSQFKVVFDALRALMAPPPSHTKKMGFLVSDKKPPK